MTDHYQAAYDAVRSRTSNGDIGRAVQEHLGSLNLSHYAERAAEYIGQIVTEYQRPSIMLRLVPKRDGDHWCVLHGENPMEGVEAFGKSPDEAMRAFDTEWFTKLEAKS